MYMQTPGIKTEIELLAIIFYPLKTFITLNLSQTASDNGVASAISSEKGFYEVLDLIGTAQVTLDLQ